MPGTMFQAVVSPRTESKSKWYTVPVLCLVHATLLAVAVAVPVVATDVALPAPRSLIQPYVASHMPVVPQPPAMRHAAPTQTAQTAVAAPVVAPDTIGVETGLISEPAEPATANIDAIDSGFGPEQGVIELSPPAPDAPTAPVPVGGNIKPPARTKYVMPD